MLQVDKENLLRDYSRDGKLEETKKLFVRDKTLDLNATNPVNRVKIKIQLLLPEGLVL